MRTGFAASLFICVLIPANLRGQVSSGALEAPAARRPVESMQSAAAEEKATARQRRRESATIVVAPGPGGVMIACEDPEVLKEFEQMLAGLAGSSGPSAPEFTIFYLKFAKVAAVAETLGRILGGGIMSSSGSTSSRSVLGGGTSTAAGGTGGSLLGSPPGTGGTSGTNPPARTLKIIPEPRLNALIVQAEPTEVAAIEQLLTILDQKEGPEEVLVVPKAKLIPVKNVQAEEVANILRQVFQDRMTLAAGQAGQRLGPQNFFPLAGGGPLGFGGFGGFGGGPLGLGGDDGGGRGRGDTGQRGAGEQTQKMTLGVDPRTNSIILAAPEPLFSEVQQLIKQLDQAALTESNQTMRVLALRKAASPMVQQALTALMGNGVQFGATGMGPAGAPTATSSRRFTQQSGSRTYRGSQTNGPTPGSGYQPAAGYQSGAYQPGLGYPSPGGYQPDGYAPSSGYPSSGGYQPGGMPNYGTPAPSGSPLRGTQSPYQPPVTAPSP